jgi:hypothetical protein
MSDFLGPFNVRPGILERSTRLIDLVTRHRNGTTALRLYGAPTLEDAYGTMAGSGLAGSGGTVFLEVRAGGLGQTPTVSKSWSVLENRKGHTSFQVNLEDIPGSPPDAALWYVRLQEQRGGVWLTSPGPVNPGFPIRGPILVVPYASFYGASASVLSLQSLAPLGTGCLAGQLPVVDMTVQTSLPLHFVLPRPAASLILRNLSAGDDLLVSFGLGMPMLTVSAGEVTVPTGGGYAQPGVREIVLATDPTAGAVIPFSVEITFGMEIA